MLALVGRQLAFVGTILPTVGASAALYLLTFMYKFCKIKFCSQICAVRCSSGHMIACCVPGGSLLPYDAPCVKRTCKMLACMCLVTQSTHSSKSSSSEWELGCHEKDSLLSRSTSGLLTPDACSVSAPAGKLRCKPAVAPHGHPCGFGCALACGAECAAWVCSLSTCQQACPGLGLTSEPQCTSVEGKSLAEMKAKRNRMLTKGVDVTLVGIPRCSRHNVWGRQGSLYQE